MKTKNYISWPSLASELGEHKNTHRENYNLDFENLAIACDMSTNIGSQFH